MKKEIVKDYLNQLNINQKITTLEDIKNLICKHEKNFAFSSLKVLLNRNISLKLEDIYNSIILKKEGGYCFEHNKLFYEVLKELGFDVKYYLARVVNNTDVEVPQTHRFTLLNFEDEEYLIDVGIGFRSPCVAVKFGEEFTKSHLGISYRVRKLDNENYCLQQFYKGNFFTVTKFSLNRCYEADFELGHFYSHKHPKAVFVNNLVVSLITENEIRSLRNGEYMKIYENSQEKIFIENFDSFKKIIKKDFNINLKEEDLKTLYDKYVKKLD